MVLAVMLGGGCARPTLPIPEELAPADRLEVHGMRMIRTPDTLAFGSYRATDIDRSWTRGSGLSVAGVSSNRARQSYAFRFVDGTAEHDAHEKGQPDAIGCESSAHRRGLDLRVIEVDGGADVVLECAPLTRTGEDGEWRLSLASVRDRHLQGELTAGTSRFQVRGQGRGGRIAPAETHGYHVLREGRVVAAVETVAPGAVWLAPELEAGERRMLAKGAIALLLYEEPATDS